MQQQRKKSTWRTGGADATTPKARQSIPFLVLCVVSGIRIAFHALLSIHVPLASWLLAPNRRTLHTSHFNLVGAGFLLAPLSRPPAFCRGQMLPNAAAAGTGSLLALRESRTPNPLGRASHFEGPSSAFVRLVVGSSPQTTPRASERPRWCALAVRLDRFLAPGRVRAGASDSRVK